jgi:glycosyltransferase involved in cell wall biosynthesis
VSASPVVSIVIPTFKRRDRVRKAILSAFAQDLPPEQYEILVVDSSPDDQVVTLVKELEPRAPCSLRCLVKKPEGPGPSRNLGVAEGRGEFIAFMDSDCEAAPSWLRHGLAVFEEGVGIVQGRTLPDPEGRPGLLTWCPTNERESCVYECANLFYRRTAFEAVHGFPADRDPLADRPLGGEDVTVAWNVKRLGWRSRFAADAIVYHEVVPLTPWQWLLEKRLGLWPSLVRRFPELRQFLVARFFLDRAQAYLCLGLVGMALAAWTPFSLLLWAPYLVHHGSPPTRRLPGLLRPLRILPFLARDVIRLFFLAWCSLRARCVVL